MPRYEIGAGTIREVPQDAPPLPIAAAADVLARYTATSSPTTAVDIDGATYFIRKLDYQKALAIAAGAYTWVPDGEEKRAPTPTEVINARSVLTLASGIAVDEAGTAPLFTQSQVEQMTTNPAFTDLVINLIAAVGAVNPGMLEKKDW